MVKGIDKRTTYRIGDIIRTNAPSLANNCNGDSDDGDDDGCGCGCG
jgi:hypothetical protein